MKTYLAGWLTAQAGAVALASLVGCSSGSAPVDTGPPCDPCDDAGSALPPVGAGHDSNPDGVPYPDPPGGYGRTARVGNTPGSVIQNFKFLGYPNADESSGLQTISLADYYDPCNKTYKLLHLSVAAVWCEPCNEETSAVVADLNSASSVIKGDKAVFIQALDDGPVEGTGATLNDLNYWVKEHTSNFTEMLDPDLKNLGGFFNAAAIPWNCDIDPRTMEIIDASEGWAGSVAGVIDPALSDLPTTPGYPLPASVSCN
jgi:hypothetical protein